MSAKTEETKREQVTLSKVPQRELLAIAWQQLGKRLHPGTDPAQIIDLLRYKHDAPIQHNPVNELRDELIMFIAENKTELSLPCDGDCYKHCDAVVAQCYIEFARDVHVEAELSAIDQTIETGKE